MAATPLIERRGVSGQSRFGYLSAAIGCRDATRRIWTASKVRLQRDGFAPDVWACTRAEIDLFAGLSENDRQTRDDLIAAGALSQMDGVVDLAVSQKTPGQTQPEPRFDITSLDAFQAAETRTTTRIGGAPDIVDLVTLRTVGFALIDRWRDNSALVQALNSLRRDDPKATEQVVDAEDLTTGYRMDVAVEYKGALAWRSLCNRSILFAEDDPLYEKLLGRAVPDQSDRLMFDAGSVIMPAKIVMQGDRGTAHVEDIVGIWTGPSIGVDAESRTVVLGKNAAALRLGHVYSLGPGPGIKAPLDWLIPRLLFGGGYHLGLTPRLLGGIARPLAGGRVYRQPGTPATQDFGILPARAAGPRRFLRHERIEAPIIATPEPILARTFDGIADGLRETSRDVIVRSKRGAKDFYDPLDAARSVEVRTSHRIVVPPSVSAVFVDRHGFFADTTQESDLTPYRGDDGYVWNGPRDGLRDVDYDQETGGFPVFGFSKSSDGGIEAAPNSHVRPSGDAVFRPRSGPAAARRSPYYPDPAASFIVVAVRDAAGRQLRGKPLVVPTRTPDVDYPDVSPLALEVKALGKRSGKAASQERILGLHMADGRILRGDAILSGKRGRMAVASIDGGDVLKAGGSGVPATRVEVALEPGESFEIDVWCLPTVDDLARWFDAVETAALIASLDANGGTCPDCETFKARLDALDLGALLTRADRLLHFREDIDTKICTSGKVEMPRGAVRCMARIVFQTLLERPTPEIAARTTITATHAIAQPHAAPSLAVVLRRQQISLPTPTPVTVPTPIPTPTPAPTQQKEKQAPDRAVEILGEVSVDRPTTGFFEIRAAGASLVSNAFDDDARRRRTPDEFARGLWPRSPVTGERSGVSGVYGFDVARDGKVTLTSEQATLLRVDEDVPESTEENAGIVKHNLVDLQCRAKQSLDGAKGAAGNTANKVAVDHPFQITDTRARILSLTAVAGSRTAWCFRDAKGDLLDAAAAVVGEAQTIVLPAAKAPAKVSPLTILPAFALHDPGPRHRKGITTFEQERKVRLRIRMRRPWFSSGEGERLGIVLWPPDILKNRIAPSGASVARDYDVPGAEKADISMQAFSDADLGPGGSFVTRWGLDPIKGGEDQISWLMPKSAFPDLDKANVHSNEGSDHAVLGDDPLYVPRASVPIPVDDASGAQTRVRLEAALLTYVPRFDVDHEAWFCDVELVPGLAPEPFVRLGLVRYQPYAPPELQVSEPVVEWVQIPQRRTVCVTIEDKRPNLISVVIQGTGRTYGGAAVAGYDPSRVESWTQRPIMKVSVLRRRDDGVEDVAQLADSMIDGGAAGFSRRAERAWAPRTQDEWTNALKVPRPAGDGQLQPQFAIRPDSPNESGLPLSWTAKFALTENALKPSAGVGTFSVFIEEVEPMLPTTYAEEPVDDVIPADRRVELAFSGPRFAARVDIAPVQ